MLIEPRDNIARLVTDMISFRSEIDVLHTRDVYDAINLLTDGQYDLILSNVQLTDAAGPEVLNKLGTVPDCPPVILTGDSMSHRAAMPLLRKGAGDYLHIPTTSIEEFQKAIMSSIERRAFNNELYELVVIDELTQLYNRRGFTRLGRYQLETARRNNAKCCAVFIDMDNLKVINDTLGHTMGDTAIREVAQCLQQTLRSTDVIARLGGDEFVVLAYDITEKTIHPIIQRFRAKLRELNEDPRRVYVLSASVGVVEYDPNSDIKLEDLQDSSCKKMYKEKHRKPGARRRNKDV